MEICSSSTCYLMELLFLFVAGSMKGEALSQGRWLTAVEQIIPISCGETHPLMHLFHMRRLLVGIMMTGCGTMRNTVSS